jgi:hypothetical protein
MFFSLFIDGNTSRCKYIWLVMLWVHLHNLVELNLPRVYRLFAMHLIYHTRTAYRYRALWAQNLSDSVRAASSASQRATEGRLHQRIYTPLHNELEAVCVFKTYTSLFVLIHTVLWDVLYCFKVAYWISSLSTFLMDIFISVTWNRSHVHCPFGNSVFR